MRGIRIPRVLIGSPSGHSGKTVISIGIVSSLTKRGLKVQTFKKGPDYIDPSWLKAASGRPCRNLDVFLMGERTILSHFVRYSLGADLAIIEGNMGLYDGIGKFGKGSSAHISRILKTPIILVVNTEKITRSVAALIKGYQNFERGTRILGVILNNVAGERHARKLVEAIEYNLRIPVLGVVPRNEILTIGERHLGLIPYSEERNSDSILEDISAFVSRNIDLERIVEIARGAKVLKKEVPLEEERKRVGVAKIAVFYDEAFQFYYPENIESLEEAGAEIVFVDSMRDRRLPDVDGLYIGGGFPEIYLEEISSNTQLMEDVLNFVNDGKPVFAECGGLMYLCESIEYKGESKRMVGAIPADVVLTRRPQGHGYVSAFVIQRNPFFPKSKYVKGHEFHHSTLRLKSEVNFALKLTRGKGVSGLNDGILIKNTFASYTHFHALSDPLWAKRFVRACVELKDGVKSNYSIKGRFRDA